MNKFKLLVACATFTLMGANSVLAAMKYKKGDCITPTDTTYSWFGKLARVEAVTPIDGYTGKHYILAFPSSISSSVIFSTDIEDKTKTVDKSKCEPR